MAELDVTDIETVRGVIGRAFRDFGRIDVVVNNAGYGQLGAAEELSDEEIRRQIDTNVVGSIQVIRAALPHLRDQGGGRILQVSSEGGQIAYPHFSLYHTSKWAIEGFVESVAQETAPFGVEFTIVEPGAFATDFGAKLSMAAEWEVYRNTPSGEMRRRVNAGNFKAVGDPEKGARAMIDSVQRNPAPKRLALGSDAYTHIDAGLRDRLAQLEAEKAVTLSTDKKATCAG